MDGDCDDVAALALLHVLADKGEAEILAALLQLPADAAHPSGLDLVTKKVKLWACMGGNFIGKPAKDDLQLGNVNFQKDAPATFYTINHWPSRVVFVGREVASVPSGVKIGARFKELPATHPVRIAYEAYFDGATKDRHIADPCTVLFAVRGPRDCWDMETKGHMDLHEDMKFEWQYDTDKNQAYLLKRIINGQPNDRAVEKLVEDLVITPPQRPGK